MNFDYYSNCLYLEHHGIKGQKWGIRRFQNPDGSLTPFGRKHRMDREFKGKVRDDDDIFISKNTKLYRVSDKEDNGSDMKYMTFRDNDRNFYKGHWVEERRKQGKDSYEHEYSSKTGLLIPSKNKRKEMMNQLIDDDDVLIEYVGQDAWKQELNYFGGDEKKALADMRDQLKVLTDEQKAQRMAANIAGRPKALAAYGKMVVQAGFNATVDDNGTAFGELPIIVMNSNKNLTYNGKSFVDEMTSKKLDKIGVDIIKSGRKFRNKVSTLRAKNY